MVVDETTGKLRGDVNRSTMDRHEPCVEPRAWIPGPEGLSVLKVVGVRSSRLQSPRTASRPRRRPDRFFTTARRTVSSRFETAMLTSSTSSTQKTKLINIPLAASRIRSMAGYGKVLTRSSNLPHTGGVRDPTEDYAPCDVWLCPTPRRVASRWRWLSTLGVIIASSV